MTVLPGAGRQRIDKWLWHARLAKTRTGAQRLVEEGHMRLNGRRVTGASQPVKPGDVLTIAFDNRVVVVEVKGFSARRVGAPLVFSLYEDKSPPPVPGAEKPVPGLVRDRGAGRPTKRDRRRIELIRGRD